jgi:hypothetical protein
MQLLTKAVLSDRRRIGIMGRASQMTRGIVVTGFAGLLVACGAGTRGPTDPAANGAFAAPGGGNGGGGGSSAAGTLRLRCEVRPGRSKISVDGNNLSPRNGTFSARVQASGGSAVAGPATAIGDEVEFDFDSNPGDIAEGATRIPATFITAQTGPDVVAEIRNAQNQGVASASGDCEFH